MKILVIRFSSLGDCVLLCPLIEHLKAQGADEVAVVTKTVYAELFAAACGLDRVVALEPGTGLAGLRRVIEACRGRGYIVLDAHSTTRSRLISMGLGGSDARVKKYYRQRLGLIILKRQTSLPSVGGRYSALAESLGFPSVDKTVGGIRVPDAVRKRVDPLMPQNGRRTIVFAPGSRWPMKQWGEEKFLELTRRMTENHGCNVIFIGDRLEAGTTGRICEAVDAYATDLAGELSIMETAAVMERSKGFVGNDSGLMHLAEAVGIPVLGLFGPTVEAFGYFPSGPGSKVIERDIGCRPCSRNGSRRCPKGTQECLVEIPVAPVERAVADLLEKRGDSRYVLQ